MAPRETENNTYATFWVHNKEHYGMLRYFLEWSISCRSGWPRGFGELNPSPYS